MLKDTLGFSQSKGCCLAFRITCDSALIISLGRPSAIAGKKAGEFYTPSEVVRVCDPTVCSGGMLIQMHNYLRGNGGSALIR